jgi:hypothetical protein
MVEKRHNRPAAGRWTIFFYSSSPAWMNYRKRRRMNDQFPGPESGDQISRIDPNFSMEDKLEWIFSQIYADFFADLRK